MLGYAFMGALAGLGVAVLGHSVLSGIGAVYPHPLIGVVLMFSLFWLTPFAAGLVAGYLGGTSSPPGAGIGALAGVLLVVLAGFVSTGPAGTDVVGMAVVGFAAAFLAATVSSVGGIYGARVRISRQSAESGDQAG